MLLLRNPDEIQTTCQKDERSIESQVPSYIYLSEIPPPQHAAPDHPTAGALGRADQQHGGRHWERIRKGVPKYGVHRA